MPVLTITLTNAHALRLQTALERELTAPEGSIGVPEAEAYIRQHLKDIVLHNEQQALLEESPIASIDPT